MFRYEEVRMLEGQTQPMETYLWVLKLRAEYYGIIAPEGQVVPCPE